MTDIAFIESHRPSLPPGDYQIVVEQTVTGPGIVVNNHFPAAGELEACTRHVSVSGQRFGLEPGEIEAVFPPRGSLGDHANVLPHIVLHRSTLPWERRVAPDDDVTPWLAILVLDDEEDPEPQTVTIAELKALGPGEPRFPELVDRDAEPPGSGVYLALEYSQHDDDRMTVIDVPRSLLEPLLPSVDELPYLTHVRQVDDQERAVVLGNRLPRPNGTSVAHLVSLEHRFRAGAFDYQGAGQDDLIRLVSLHRWRFSCEDPEQSFTGLLEGLDRSPSTLRLPDASPIVLGPAGAPGGNVLAELDANEGATVSSVSGVDDAELPVAGAYGTLRWVQHGAYHYQLDTTHAAVASLAAGATLTESFSCTLDDGQGGTTEHTLELTIEQTRASAYLATGRVALPHFLRQYQQTYSWYHGPLITGARANEPIDLPVAAADALLIYDPDAGMLDVSYAAAWELGRLLALRDRELSAALYRWKLDHAHALRQAEQSLFHLGQPTNPRVDALPELIDAWFRGLSLLEGVPFIYLVPDERMLPRESIRWFQLDPYWVDCLIDGAFSIGRVSARAHERERDHPARPATHGHPSVSGVLLRSDVVAGWPGLEVDASDSEGAALPRLRMQRLSEHVLLCLFAGEAERVDIHQRPELMHFGFDRDDEQGQVTFAKHLRDDQGNQTALTIDPITSWRDPSRRVVDLLDLAAAIETVRGGGTVDPAQFALEMIEGVQKLTFKKS